MEDMTEEQLAQLNKDIVNTSYIYVTQESMLEAVLGERRKSVYLNDRATARLSNIIGFIYATWLNDQETARKMFLDLRANFQRLDATQMHEDDRYSYCRTNPTMITLMSDDGSFGGFGFCHYLLTKELEEMPSPKNRPDGLNMEEAKNIFHLYDWLPHDMYYRRYYNGGLLYHRAGETSPLGDVAFWSIHT